MTNQPLMTYTSVLSFCTALLFVLLTQPAPACAAGASTGSDTSVAKKARSHSFLALGDSYTIGQSVDSAERFPAQAAALLARYGYTVPVVDYLATTGWKTVNLQWAMEGVKWHTTYDVVTLLIGVNDQYLLRDTIQYRSRFENLLQKAVALANHRRTHVFVLSLPDYGVTPFGKNNAFISRQIDDFNAINKSVALQYGVSYIDITGISRYDAIDNAMLATDGLHPSGRQYAQWARLLVNKMLVVFKNNL